MRFMVIVKASEESESGKLPEPAEFAAMHEFNESLAKDGVLLAAEGLQASSKGARMTFSAGEKPAVTDGPFAETKELIAGFWLIQAKSKAEVLERYVTCPFEHGEIEIRQVFEAEDFGDSLSPEIRELDARHRA